jgi:hypothetical protein
LAKRALLIFLQLSLGGLAYSGEKTLDGWMDGLFTAAPYFALASGVSLFFFSCQEEEDGDFLAAVYSRSAVIKVNTVRTGLDMEYGYFSGYVRPSFWTVACRYVYEYFHK